MNLIYQINWSFPYRCIRMGQTDKYQLVRPNILQQYSEKID